MNRNLSSRGTTSKFPRQGTFFYSLIGAACLLLSAPAQAQSVAAPLSSPAPLAQVRAAPPSGLGYSAPEDDLTREGMRMGRKTLLSGALPLAERRRPLDFSWAKGVSLTKEQRLALGRLGHDYGVLRLRQSPFADALSEQNYLVAVAIALEDGPFGEQPAAYEFAHSTIEILGEDSVLAAGKGFAALLQAERMSAAARPSVSVGAGQKKRSQRHMPTATQIRAQYHQAEHLMTRALALLAPQAAEKEARQDASRAVVIAQTRAFLEQQRELITTHIAFLDAQGKAAR